jgi:hypothetical protein
VCAHKKKFYFNSLSCRLIQKSNMKPVFFLSLFVFKVVLSGQPLSYYLPQDVEYNASIPTPNAVIGHEVGEWHITHDKLILYMQTLAQASDRITLINRGVTYEGRPLILLIITHPENHKNIDNIRLQHLALTEPESAALNIKDMPVVIHQGFSIHGNEPSGSNASLLAAYYLAAAEGNEIETILKNAVILFDPSFNPDGLQRFSTWVNMHKSKNINPDPQDREYSESWPGGRTNHYWFDMNRDWLPVQLNESRVRIETFQQWYPNILTDHHEMGTNSTFFFQPGIPSRTHPLIPEMNQKLTAEIAAYHVKGLNNIGSLYYSEEDFDDYYFGKGSTYPDLHGGIGILFEQASSRGHAQESENGILTFPFTIRNQFTTALSTIRAGIGLREKLLQYQRSYYQNALKDAEKGWIVFGDEKDASKVYHLAEILQRHQIKLHDISADFSLKDKSYKKGYAFMVSKNQKQANLIKAIFEIRNTFNDSLFYDISAWTFPLAFNLDYDENAPSNLVGNEVKTLVKPKGKLIGSDSDYAYLIEWHDYYTPKALYALLKKGLIVKTAMKQFQLEGRNYDYGTLLIPASIQPIQKNQLSEFLNDVAVENGINIYGVKTGLTEGPDLGSRNFMPIKLPKVALLIGDGITYADAGEIWHLFDQRYDIPITKIDTRNLGRVDLKSYTHLIIPNIQGGAISKDESDKIKTWVSSGGILITFKNAMRWATTQEMLKAKYKSNREAAVNINFENKENYAGARGIGGSIFMTQIDRSHPINFGYKNNLLPLFKNATLIMEADEQSYNNPILFTEKPLLSGYIHPETLKELGNTAAFRSSSLGKGNVIGFTENTNLRAFWFGTNKLMMNAIFYGHLF